RSRTILIRLPAMLTYWMSKFIGLFVGDVVLTTEEVIGLMDNLLVTNSPPAGKTKLSEWVAENKDWLGEKYHNEIKRHFVKK
ncbi:MAG: epimerase, partial [Chloroflexota bacterium]